ncbi:serine-threonine kinase [Baekduia alba]|uniref:protein kinase domain-containing protein n=1 Tax=Baekduia alba TaxID=2997333 RepID=UPI0023403D85|nr:protein kinase [Baekduia alba]WCB93716.1 serine-threonine kinase [Baekduia alba]
MPALSQQVDLPPRYRVVRHIANGGMATVWAAEDSVLERLVAVKVLAAGYAVDQAARRRFTREARAAARVSDHPNVVTIFDIGEMSSPPAQAFIVMEHFAGGTVADRLRAGDVVPAPLALRWLSETASALDAAHAADIVHRDVKPGNLLLDENGRLAVGDFGIASLAGETAVTAAGQVLGTAAYLSPEQARGHAATPASDRYSLAVVAYELLCGKRPFAGDTPMAQARARVEQDPATLTGHCIAAEEPLRWGLSRDPAGRPATAAAFVAELARALGSAGEPTRVTKVMAPAPAPRFARNRAPEVFPDATAGRPPIAVPVPAAEAGAVRERPRDPVARQRHPHRRAFMLAALAAGCVVIGAGAALISDDGRGTGKGGTAPRATASKSQGVPTGGIRQRAAASATTAAPDASTPPPAASSTPAPTTPSAGDPRSAVDINNAGYKMLPGDAQGAVPLLQSAVDKFRAQGDTKSINYAFSLYNLGWALRLAGRPADAIPYLQERLRISDYKRGIVEKELATAQSAAGVPATGASAKGHGKAKGKAKHDKGAAGPGGLLGSGD